MSEHGGTDPPTGGGAAATVLESIGKEEEHDVVLDYENESPEEGEMEDVKQTTGQDPTKSDVVEAAEDGEVDDLEDGEVKEDDDNDEDLKAYLAKKKAAEEAARNPPKPAKISLLEDPFMEPGEVPPPDGPWMREQQAPLIRQRQPLIAGGPPPLMDLRQGSGPPGGQMNAGHNGPIIDIREAAPPTSMFEGALPPHAAPFPHGPAPPIVCRFFMRGYCNNGVNCRFFHPMPPGGLNSIQDQNCAPPMNAGPPPMLVSPGGHTHRMPFHGGPPPQQNVPRFNGPLPSSHSQPPDMHHHNHHYPVTSSATAPADPQPSSPSAHKQSAWERGLKEAKTLMRKRLQTNDSGDDVVILSDEHEQAAGSSKHKRERTRSRGDPDESFSDQMSPNSGRPSRVARLDSKELDASSRPFSGPCEVYTYSSRDYRRQKERQRERQRERQSSTSRRGGGGADEEKGGRRPRTPEVRNHGHPPPIVYRGRVRIDNRSRSRSRSRERERRRRPRESSPRRRSSVRHHRERDSGRRRSPRTVRQRDSRRRTRSRTRSPGCDEFGRMPKDVNPNAGGDWSDPWQRSSKRKRKASSSSDSSPERPARDGSQSSSTRRKRPHRSSSSRSPTRSRTRSRSYSGSSRTLSSSYSSSRSPSPKNSKSVKQSPPPSPVREKRGPRTPEMPPQPLASPTEREPVKMTVNKAKPKTVKTKNGEYRGPKTPDESEHEPDDDESSGMQLPQDCKVTDQVGDDDTEKPTDDTVTPAVVETRTPSPEEQQASKEQKRQELLKQLQVINSKFTEIKSVRNTKLQRHKDNDQHGVQAVEDAIKKKRASVADAQMAVDSSA